MRKYVHCTVVDSEKSEPADDFEPAPNAWSAHPKPPRNTFGIDGYRAHACSFMPNPPARPAVTRINLYA